MTCPNCGHPMQGNRFCPHCGFSIPPVVDDSWTRNRKLKQFAGCWLFIMGFGVILLGLAYALLIGLLSACASFGNGSQAPQQWPPTGASIAMLIGAVIVVGAIGLWFSDYFSKRPR